MISLAAILILSYLTGSIPASIIAGKLLKGIDVRDYGSGNAGGTNAFRVLGWRAGLVVSLFDIAKGGFAVLVISQLRIDGLPFASPALVQILAGVCAILGHSFTIFAGFKGGKGVATGAGMIAALYPIAFLICLTIFALILLFTGIVSIASISAAIALPFILVVVRSVFGQPIDPALLIFSIIIPFFIIFTHRTNIRRLFKGEEKRFENIAIFRNKKAK